LNGVRRAAAINQTLLLQSSALQMYMSSPYNCIILTVALEKSGGWLLDAIDNNNDNATTWSQTAMGITGIAATEGS
jgi:hypothetical protein